MTKKLTALLVTVSLLAMCFAVSVSAQENKGYVRNTTGFKYDLIQPGGIDGNYIVALGDEINQKINWGTIDKNGKVVIPVEKTIDEVMSDEALGLDRDYTVLWNINENTGEQERFSLLDSHGRVIIPEGKYKSIIDHFDNTDFKEFFVVVDNNDKYGIYDAKSQTLAVPCMYSWIAPGFKDGLVCVEYNNKSGFIDKGNNIILGFKYDVSKYFGTYEFGNGQAIVTVNGVNQIITKTGEVVTRIEGYNIVNFVDKAHKYLAVGNMKNDKLESAKIIDYSGKVMIDNIANLSYADNYCANAFGNLVVLKDSKYYLYNDKLEKITDTAYDMINFALKDDVIMCTKKANGKTYYDYFIDGKKVISDFENNEIGDMYILVNKTTLIVADDNFKFALFRIAYQNPNYSYNDISGDKKVSTVDALLILRHKAGVSELDETKQALGDVDNNKKLTTVDALLILKYVAGIYE